MALTRHDVDVYWNLHKGGWSVRSRLTGRVMMVVDSVALRDVRFVVQPAGRERVRREGKKNVHAFARGRLITCDDIDWLMWPVAKAIYNPYRYDEFVNSETGLALPAAKYVYLNTHREVMVMGDENGVAL